MTWIQIGPFDFRSWGYPKNYTRSFKSNAEFHEWLDTSSGP